MIVVSLVSSCGQGASGFSLCRVRRNAAAGCSRVPQPIRLVDGVWCQNAIERNGRNLRVLEEGALMVFDRRGGETAGYDGAT